MEQDILSIIYQILASPSKVLEEIGRRKPLVWAMIAAVFIVVVVSFTMLPNPPELLEVIFDMEKGSFNLALAIFLWVIMVLIVLFIQGGIFHFIAVLLGGKGNYLGMVCGLCFACFPFVFFTPLTLLRSIFGATGNILYPIGSLALFTWVFYLGIIVIHQNYRFSLGRAIFTYFTPIILLIFLPLLVVTVLIAL
jgi:hypothetical protein